jgi:hypothetical protein
MSFNDATDRKRKPVRTVHTSYTYGGYAGLPHVFRFRYQVGLCSLRLTGVYEYDTYSMYQYIVCMY